MEKGIDSGMTYHEASMTRVSKQFDNLLNFSNVEDTGFYNPFKGLDGESEKVVEIQREAKRVIENQVMPAYQKLRGIVKFICSKKAAKRPINKLANVQTV